MPDKIPLAEEIDVVCQLFERGAYDIGFATRALVELGLDEQDAEEELVRRM